MIVEDESGLREAMAEVIATTGYEVLTANDGEQGLATALEQKPDLILLDLRMPVMDGLTMLSRLRDDEWGATVKVMVMTALDDLNSASTAHQEGPLVEYIVKTNISLEDLTAKVKETVG